MVAGATFCLGVGGGYTGFICLPAGEVVPVPSSVDPAEAVCLVVNYLTAHAALHRTAGVRSGERILVHGAAGGVGTALVRCGRDKGAGDADHPTQPAHAISAGANSVRKRAPSSPNLAKDNAWYRETLSRGHSRAAGGQALRCEGH
jgi:D-arabinose 1-dehydrogenase-like Zn-dependent alcohol dehydrogenase